MLIVDWIALTTILISMLFGLWRGFIYIVTSIVGWAASLFLALCFAPYIATQLPQNLSGAVLRYSAAFVLVFICALLLSNALASLLRHIVLKIHMKSTDSILGMILTTFFGCSIILLASVFIFSTSLQHAIWWKNSFTAILTAKALHAIYSLLPVIYLQWWPINEAFKHIPHHNN